MSVAAGAHARRERSDARARSRIDRARFCERVHPVHAVGLCRSFLTTGFAALINATTPLWAGVVGLLWLNAKLTRLQWVGLALGVIGMAVLTWGKVDFKPNGSGLAIAAGLTVTLAYGFASHFAKRRLSNVSPLGVATGSQLVGAILVLPLAVIYWPEGQPSAKAWVAATLLAVLATAIALILYFRLISRLGGQKVSTVTFLIPFFSCACGRGRAR